MKLLDDPQRNKLLVDTLEETKLERQKITVVESDPSDVTDIPTILFNRTTNKLLICDTTEWRSIATEAL